MLAVPGALWDVTCDCGRQEARRALSDAVAVLCWEPRVQPEGQLALEAAEELTQLDLWLRENLPAAEPTAAEREMTAADPGPGAHGREGGGGTAEGDQPCLEPARDGNAERSAGNGCEVFSSEHNGPVVPSRSTDGVDCVLEAHLCGSSVREPLTSADAHHDALKDLVSIG